MSEKLKLNATWNLDPLPASEQTSLAYLLVDITQEDPSSQGVVESITQNHALERSEGSKLKTMPSNEVKGQNSLNLSLVLDTSGSMGGAKLQNLKGAVRWVLGHLGPQDSLAVTLFDDEVHPLIPTTRMSDPHVQGLAAQVDAIREAGGTAMSKGLLVGLDEAMKGLAPGAISRIILLTDGQTWGDAERCKELAAQAGARGIPVTALGVGAEEDWSIELLDDIAAQSGGQSGYIERPEEIAQAFQDTVLAMQQTAARNLRITANPSRGVEMRAAYRVAPVISKLWPGIGSNATLTGGQGGSLSAGSEPAISSKKGQLLTLPLGDLEASVGQTLLFEVVMPARKPGQYRLARLLLTYETAGSHSTQEEAALDLVATFAVGVKSSPGDPRVMNSVEKATTFKLQTRALQASMVGDVANATRNLRAAATRLLNMGETELAEATEKEAQLLETAGKMSAGGTKKLAFDTRKLAVSETVHLPGTSG